MRTAPTTSYVARAIRFALDEGSQVALLNLPALRRQLATLRNHYRLQISARLISDGVSQARAARALGVSPAWLSTMRRRVAEQGFSALISKPSPRGARRVNYKADRVCSLTLLIPAPDSAERPQTRRPRPTIKARPRRRNAPIFEPPRFAEAFRRES